LPATHAANPLTIKSVLISLAMVVAFFWSCAGAATACGRIEGFAGRCWLVG
jgi:hypothetical protein